MAKAETSHAHAHDHQAPAKLTRNQSMVFSALREQEKPLTAYAILDRLRGDGLRAPLQIYRALEKLMEKGLVHRLESLNAFVACQHEACSGHSTVAFAICESCGVVDEIEDEVANREIERVARERGFLPTRATVELKGLCADCR